MTFERIHPFLTPNAEDTYEISFLAEELVYFFTPIFFLILSGQPKHRLLPRVS